MINLADSDLEAIQKDAEQGVAPGMGDVHLMVAQIRRLTSSGKDLLVERQALAGLLKRFVDGEHDLDENQAERHMYHGEAQTLLAFLGGDLPGHTLVPDAALRAQRDQIEKLTADEQEAGDLCDRLSDLLRNTAIEVRGPEAPLKRHGFADLPSRVKTVVAEREKLKAENGTLFAAAQALRDEWRRDQADAARYRRIEPVFAGLFGIASLDAHIDAVMIKESDATQDTHNENVSRHEGG
ncbi:hypothetical protein K0P33_21310 [Pseudomonas sp. ArH3a]|uniref:hypothetical protein n=1 Tax=Pseudomonas sp. ArH3a TaxID=2862945 RepID=UPI001F5842A8|nr:hypothetical protein [Pseudomonas sp. ArH3a]UNM18080.1 hypothetical protein K0P33_21310 [Pseudomonas sp. ArH3a]